MSGPAWNWMWQGKCVNVVDGDTIDVILDVGFRSVRTERLRILGVNCPEIHSSDPKIRAAGLAAKQRTQERIDSWQDNRPEPFPLIIYTHKADAFGRYLARVESAIFAEMDLGQTLLVTGYAVPYTR